VYVGGYFTSAGGAGANRIAKWSGSDWSSLGSGINGGVYAINVSGSDVYVGGSFSLAGGKSSSHIACWHEPNHDISLSIQMTNYSATVKSDGGIELSWKTESEVSCAGFYVWRCETENGKYKPVNNSMIPGQGNKSSATEYQYTDFNINYETTYWYKIEQIDISGKSDFYGPFSAKTLRPIPKEYELSQNYPNPFNPITHISYSLPQAGPVLLRVFDMNGRMIRSLKSGTVSAGSYEIEWDGRNDKGEMVATGIYIMRMDANENVFIKKMMFVK
jgi:hypothetical protein